MHKKIKNIDGLLAFLINNLELTLSWNPVQLH